jgi:hypothetical protein
VQKITISYGISFFKRAGIPIPLAEIQLAFSQSGFHRSVIQCSLIETGPKLGVEATSRKVRVPGSRNKQGKAVVAKRKTEGPDFNVVSKGILVHNGKSLQSSVGEGLTAKG